MALIVDDEFRSLIPSLSAEEYEHLEKSILAEGIRDKIIVWNNTIIDGHSRYEIALKYVIPFCAVEKSFNSREEAKEYIILNQFGRRNLTPYQRSILALRLKPVFEERARERMLSGTLLPTSQKSEQGKTLDNVAKVAGVSRDTIWKVEYIETKAPEEIKNKLHAGKISINRAYTTAKSLEANNEISEPIVPSELAITLEQEPEETEAFDEKKYFSVDVTEKFVSSILAILGLNTDPEHLEALVYDIGNELTIERKLDYVNLAIEKLETIKEYLSNKPK